MIDSNVSVIIITLNEEKNIVQCLKSICKWSDDIHIVDSYSRDKTVELAATFTKNIHTINQGNWATIRQWAISNINLKHEWVLFVDADEWLDEDIKNEITSLVQSSPSQCGFYIYLKFIFLNRWLKHGDQYNKALRLFRPNMVHCVPDGDNECYIPSGETGILKNDLIHQDLKSFSNWIDKHNRISIMAAKKYVELREGKIDEAVLKRSNLRSSFEKLPLISRPFLMFIYIYFFKLGFLDGIEGLIYHLHHAFWYQLLIYTKVKEIEINQE
jgi:glycosyltransferase involved in cell wall biosynthesis